MPNVDAIQESCNESSQTLAIHSPLLVVLEVKGKGNGGSRSGPCGNLALPTLPGEYGLLLAQAALPGSASPSAPL